MDTPSFAMIIQRLDRLEHENRLLAQTGRRWKWTALIALVGLGLLWTVGPRPPKPLAAQETGPAQGPEPPRGEPIRLGLGTKIVESEQVLLRDPQGDLLAVLTTNQDGLPTLSLHAKDESIRMLLRVSPDGEPGLVFFDKTGKQPAELVVSRSGPTPTLKLLNRQNQPLFSTPR